VVYELSNFKNLKSTMGNLNRRANKSLKTIKNETNIFHLQWSIYRSLVLYDHSLLYDRYSINDNVYRYTPTLQHPTKYTHQQIII